MAPGTCSPPTWMSLARWRTKISDMLGMISVFLWIRVRVLVLTLDLALTSLGLASRGTGLRLLGSGGDRCTPIVSVIVTVHPHVISMIWKKVSWTLTRRSRTATMIPCLGVTWDAIFDAKVFTFTFKNGRGPKRLYLRFFRIMDVQSLWVRLTISLCRSSFRGLPYKVGADSDTSDSLDSGQESTLVSKYVARHIQGLFQKRRAVLCSASAI